MVDVSSLSVHAGTPIECNVLVHWVTTGGEKALNNCYTDVTL